MQIMKSYQALPNFTTVLSRPKSLYEMDETKLYIIILAVTCLIVILVLCCCYTCCAMANVKAREEKVFGKDKRELSALSSANPQVMIDK